MIERRRARRHPAPTWAQASTSTRAPIGSSATPMAERAGRWSPKQLDVDLVHPGVVAAEVLEEHGGLGDVGQGRALAGEQAVEVGDRLAQLAVEPTADQLPVGDADLAGHDEPLAGSHDRRVGTDGRWPWAPVCQRQRAPVGQSVGQPRWQPRGGGHGGEHGVAAAHRRGRSLGDRPRPRSAACRRPAARRRTGSSGRGPSPAVVDRDALAS